MLVPEADYAITLLGKISCSRGVLLLLLGMLTAVELNNQAPFDAAEIGEVRTDAVLSAEFETAEAPGSEVLPQLSFLGGRFRAEPSAAIPWSFVVRIS